MMREVAIYLHQQQVRMLWVEVHQIRAFLVGGHMGLDLYTHGQAYTPPPPDADQSCYYSSSLPSSSPLSSPSILLLTHTYPLPLYPYPLHPVTLPARIA